MKSSLIKRIFPIILIVCFLFSCSLQKKSIVNTTPSSTYLLEKNQEHLFIQREKIYLPTEDWTYSHHAAITHFKGLFIATWSNAYEDEDSPGQRVMYSVSKDFFHWTEPEILAAPNFSDEGVLNILTAAGFHQFKDTLVAYFGEYDVSRKYTNLWAKISTDGIHWSKSIDMKIPVNPNLGPVEINSGRLIICGNYTFPYTDDPTGLSGWRMSSYISTDSALTLGDNPKTFSKANKTLGLPDLCEASFFQTDDGVLHGMLRNTSKPKDWFMYETISLDSGRTWSKPAKTTFPNKDSKFNFDRLPDGRFYFVGNPDTARSAIRNPLALSLSMNGNNFDKHYVIADDIYKKHKEGKAKFGQYGYPTTIIHENYMYVIISREKEAVEVIRFRWDTL